MTKRWLRALGLARPGRTLRDVVRVLRHRLSAPPAPVPEDGLPLPSALLALRVAGTPDLGWFLEGGRRAADSIREALARHGTAVEDLASVLDFGCGCGRVLRHWRALPARVHGSDYATGAIDWCRRHLRFAQFQVNQLHPPLAYGDGQFALIHALSVFTHLPEELQLPWLDELCRVLAPGGFLMISVHGTAYLPELSEPERQRFQSGHLVVRASGAPGANAFGAYHPEAYLRRLVPSRLNLLEIVPEGARGNPRQDLVVLRKARAG